MVYDRSLPTIEILVEHKETRTLVDTGCTAMLFHSNFSNGCRFTSSINAVNEREVVCRGVSTMMLEIHGWLLRVEAIVIDEIIEGIDGTMEFRRTHCAVSIQTMAMTT